VGIERQPGWGHLDRRVKRDPALRVNRSLAGLGLRRRGANRGPSSFAETGTRPPEVRNAAPFDRLLMSLRVHRLLPDPIAILTGALLGGLDYRFRGRSRVYHREAMRLLVEHTPRAVELDRVARDHAIEHAITVTMMLAPWLLSRALAEGREYLETAVNHPGSVVVGFVRTGAFPSMIALKQYAELRPTVVTVAPFILAGRLDGLKVASVCSLARRSAR